MQFVQSMEASPSSDTLTAGQSFSIPTVPYVMLVLVLFIHHTLYPSFGSKVIYIYQSWKKCFETETVWYFFTFNYCMSTEHKINCISVAYLIRSAGHTWPPFLSRKMKSKVTLKSVALPLIFQKTMLFFFLLIFSHKVYSTYISSMVRRTGECLFCAKTQFLDKRLDSQLLWSRT